MFIEWLKALLYGVIEGITEWLPVSSTGHLILIQDLVPFAFTSDKTFLEEYSEMFQVVIQLGAILAVVVAVPIVYKKLVKKEFSPILLIIVSAGMGILLFA